MADNQNPQPTGEFDPSTLDYEAWIKFFFDRPVSNAEGSGVLFSEKFIPKGSYFIGKMDHPQVIVSHLTRMCREFKFLGERYGLPKINQAIWAILGPDFDFGNYLKDRTILLDARIACIEAMLIPFRDFVRGHPVTVMENCFEMWWDFLGLGNMSTKPDDEEMALRNAVFSTLVKILELHDFRCKLYALHGLGHTEHPQRAKMVQNYMYSNRNSIDPEGWKWLEQCRDGTVM